MLGHQIVAHLIIRCGSQYTMKSSLKFFLIAIFILANTNSYAYKMSDAASIQKIVAQNTASLKSDGIDVAKIQAEGLVPIVINNVSIPAYGYPILSASLTASYHHSSVDFEKAIFSGKDACSSQTFKLKDIPSIDTLKKLSAFCFYNESSTPYWILAPKNWDIKMAYSSVDVTTDIILAPHTRDGVITLWEEAFFIPACQGCIVQKAAIFYPQLNTPENKKDYLLGVTDVTPDTPVKKVQLKSGAVGFSYTKPASALPTNGIIRVNDIDSDDKSLDELLITLPKNEMDVVQTILNNF